MGKNQSCHLKVLTKDKHFFTCFPFFAAKYFEQQSFWTKTKSFPARSLARRIKIYASRNPFYLGRKGFGSYPQRSSCPRGLRSHPRLYG
jgi:hypothetical protein